MKVNRVMSFALACVSGLGLLSASGTQAQAGFVPVLTSSAGTIFNYSLNFSTNGTTETLQSGDFVTLYDVGGLTAASQFTAIPNFNITVQPIGITPGGNLVIPNDDAGINNVTFTYNGGAGIVASDQTFNTVLTANAGFTSTQVRNYTSTDTIQVPGDNNQIGLVLVPANAVPEPASVAMLGMGFGAVVLFGRIRSRKATV